MNSLTTKLLGFNRSESHRFYGSKFLAEERKPSKCAN